MSQKSSATPQGSNLIIILIALVGVVLIAGALIILVASSQGNVSEVSDSIYSDIPQSRGADGAYILGDPDAPATVIVFEDYLCPHCQTNFNRVIAPFIEQYVATGQANVELRTMAFVDRTYSVTATAFAQCAEQLQPGLFWPSHDLMFRLAASERFSDSTARRFAELTGLDYGDLLACKAEMDRDGSGQQVVDTRYATSLGVTSTPTVAIRFGDGQARVIGQPSVDQLGELIAAGGA
jgi:protein-disulfide isomerase